MNFSTGWLSPTRLRTVFAGALTVLLAIPGFGAQLPHPQVPPHESPDRTEIADWLGTSEAGPETIRLNWTDRLGLHLGKILIPVDGTWHTTVPSWDRTWTVPGDPVGTSLSI